MTKATHCLKCETELLMKAAKEADWMQVVYNQGPPCFHIEDTRFCLRAKRWDGHKTIGGSVPIHEYVPLESLLRSIAPDIKHTHECRSQDIQIAND